MQAGKAVDRRFALYDVDDDELRTCTQITENAADGSRITLMPTHHVDKHGRLNGFRLLAANSCHTGGGPFSQEMFFGIGVCEVLAPAQDVARLISTADACRAQLLQLVEQIRANADSKGAASFKCIPQDIQGVHRGAATTSHVLSQARRAVDNRDWAPEEPTMLGVYQGHVRNSSGERRHAIFIACEGGCVKAANEYYNMMLDLGEDATLAEAVECEETWWLQKACSRARNRIMFQAAEALGLRPKASVVDTHSLHSHRIVTPVCETLRHDLQRCSGNTAQILNHAVDTTKVKNGIIVKMHPNEGLWLFRGAPRPNASNAFGGMFGDPQRCGVFPTHTFATEDKRRPGIAQGVPPNRTRFLHFNNSFQQHLQDMGWDRDYGIVELIPIAVVHMSDCV